MESKKYYHIEMVDNGLIKFECGCNGLHYMIVYSPNDEQQTALVDCMLHSIFSEEEINELTKILYESIGAV